MKEIIVLKKSDFSNDAWLTLCRIYRVDSGDKFIVTYHEI